MQIPPRDAAHTQSPHMVWFCVCVHGMLARPHTSPPPIRSRMHQAPAEATAATHQRGRAAAPEVGAVPKGPGGRRGSAARAAAPPNELRPAATARCRPRPRRADSDACCQHCTSLLSVGPRLSQSQYQPWLRSCGGAIFAMAVCALRPRQPAAHRRKSVVSNPPQHLLLVDPKRLACCGWVHGPETACGAVAMLDADTALAAAPQRHISSRLSAPSPDCASIACSKHQPPAAPAASPSVRRAPPPPFPDSRRKHPPGHLSLSPAVP